MKPTEKQLALAKAIVSEMARRAGQTKSPARAEASRRNGLLGGHHKTVAGRPKEGGQHE